MQLLPGHLASERRVAQRSLERRRHRLRRRSVTRRRQQPQQLVAAAAGVAKHACKAVRLRQLCREAPAGARLLVAGVCMEEDRIHPFVPIVKELQLQFVIGYTPEEFAGTLRAIAEGEIDTAPLVTGRVGVDRVADAFEALATPEHHAKILVEPWRDGGLS